MKYDKPQDTVKRFIEFAPSLFFSAGRHPVLTQEMFGQRCLKRRETSQSISGAVKGGGSAGWGCDRGVTLTSLLPVGSSVASSQSHGGQQLGEMNSRAQVWHRVAEVEQVLKAVSESTRRNSRWWCYTNTVRKIFLVFQVAWMVLKPLSLNGVASNMAANQEKGLRPNMVQLLISNTDINQYQLIPILTSMNINQYRYQPIEIHAVVELARNG